jgi:23S rRNA (cytidine1920-2'-O)/16S rRNA (cytidine1409-2'-O)-methyltransferase
MNQRRARMIPDSARAVNFDLECASRRFDFSPTYGYPILYMARVRKERLDLLLVERGLADSRQQAQRLILAGQVAIGDRVADKPGVRVSAAAEILVKEHLPYVSRGGFKLAAALDAFALDVGGWIAADVGASTGGFTDCLLQRGVSRVYAIDVGYGQLAWKLRQDARVVVMDRSNARYLERLPEPVDLATIDVSFISLRLILPAVTGWLQGKGQIVALIKPQFEAGPKRVGHGGVVRDPAIHRAVLRELTAWAASRELGLCGLIRSPITGPAGNVEFLAHWVPGDTTIVDVASLIEACTQPEGGDTGA